MLVKNLPIQDSLYNGRFVDFDDFIGRVIDPFKWGMRGGTGGSTQHIAGVGGQLRVTAAGGGLDYEVNQVDRCAYSAVAGGTCAFRVRIPDITLGMFEWGFDAASPNQYADWMCFDADSNSSSNWRCGTSASSVVTWVDTGIPVDTNWHVGRIELSSANAKFFFDGILVATITTNLSALLLQPFLYVYTNGASARTLYADWFEGRGYRA